MSYVRCSDCQQIVRAVIPRGGDGSVVRAYKHNFEGWRAACRGSFDVHEKSYETREDVPPRSVPREASTT